jgi:putative oxidoreductase
MSTNTSPTVFPRTKPKGLNIALWIVQSLLAALFLMAGIFKLVKPEMAKDLPAGLVYFIGISETLGGVGILLPSILRIKPMLTPLAALGFSIILVLAAIFHISRGEVSHVPPIVVFLAMSVFVVWGRYKKAPIQPK